MVCAYTEKDLQEHTFPERKKSDN